MNSLADSALLARAGPAGLGLAIDKRFQFPPHLQLINTEIMEAVARGKDRRRAIEAGEDIEDKPEILLIEAPPRHGKSTIVSEHTPPWYLGMFPDDRVILTTYEADFASTWGRKARDTLHEFGEQLYGIRVAEGSHSVKRWDLEGRKGGMVTAGVGGPITGKGANCVPAGTMVRTEVGDVPIERLCQSKHRPKVATYLEDGSTQFRRIEATRTVRSDEFVDVQTTGGHRLSCTPEHRVFVHGRGYVEAKDLRRGDRLVCLEEPIKQDVPWLRQGETGTGPTLPGLLEPEALVHDHPGVLMVSGASGEEGLRGAEGVEERAGGCVLLEGMQPSTSRDQEPAPLPDVRGADPKEVAGLLLAGVPAGREAEAHQDVRPLPRGLHPGQQRNPVLLTGLCEQGTLATDARQREPALQGRDQLRQVVSGDAPADSGARPVRLRGLRTARRADRGHTLGLGQTPASQRPDRSSHRPRSDEQRAGESGHALPRLPHDSPQVEHHTVSSVRRRRMRGERVYDLQVEGESNFFADGVLVHNCLIVDDPIKNAEEAMSELKRKKQWDWWLTTARTRLEPGGVVIVLMTRWHEDDLGGQLLRAAEDGGDPVREIRLPSLALAKDPLGREEGEALWPERYTRGYLENTRNVLGAYWFSAMYQGSPTPDEGGVFSRQYFRYFEIKGGQVILDTLNGKVEYPASSCQKVSYVDLAASEKSTGDYTVLTEVWVTPKQDMLVMNVTRDRIPGPDQPQFFEDHFVGRLKVESIGYQSTMVKALLRKGLPVEPVYPDKDKVTRASAAGALYRGGKVFHRRGAEYLAEFEAELLAFPAAEHDDQVDTIAYAAKDLPTIDTQRPRKQTKKGRTLTGGLASRDL